MNQTKLNSPETRRFGDLMTQMRAGSSEAAWQLVEEYGPHVRAVVRRMLDAKMRTLFDSEDFVQTVWASLLRAQDRMFDIDEPQRFILLLATMARNKVIDEVRRRKMTAKYDIARTQSLDDTNRHPEPESDRRQNRPSEWAVARERWQEMNEGQTDLHRRILELRLGGATYIEIAEQLEVSERTARRVVERLARTAASEG